MIRVILFVCLLSLGFVTGSTDSRAYTIPFAFMGGGGSGGFGTPIPGGESWPFCSDGYISRVKAVTSTRALVMGQFSQIGACDGGARLVAGWGGAPVTADTAVSAIPAGDVLPIKNSSDDGSAPVMTAVSDGAGGVYIGGEFALVGGVTRNNIAHLNADGSLDMAWDPDADAIVSTMVLSGGTLYVGGDFTSIGGQTRNGVAAISTTTGLAGSWNPGSVGASLYKMVLSGTTMYIGGYFSTMGGASRSNIAAVDVGSNTATAWNPGAMGMVYDMALSSTTLYIVGSFTSAGGASRAKIAALDTTVNTNNATSWNPAATGGTQGVRGIALDGTTAYVVGDFTGAGGGSQAWLAALDTTVATNNLVTAWAPVVDTPYGSSALTDVAVLGSRVYISGFLFSMGGGTTMRKGFAAFDKTSAALESWNPSFTGEFMGILALGLSINVIGSDLYLGGILGPPGVAGISNTVINPIPRGGIAAVDIPTGVLTTWNPDGQSGDPGELPGVGDAVLIGSTLYVGGTFVSIGGEARYNLAAVNPNVDAGTATAWDVQVNGPIWTLEADGSILYLGGDFSEVDVESRFYIAAVDTTLNSGMVKAWDPMVNDDVRMIRVVGSTVYIAGDFQLIDGGYAPYVAALDKTVDTGNLLPWAPEPDNTVTDILVDGSIVYVSGTFENIGGEARNGIAAVDAVTGLATSWDAGLDATSNAGYLALYGTQLFAASPIMGAMLISSGSTTSRFGHFDTSTAVLTDWTNNVGASIVDPYSGMGYITVSGTTVYVTSLAINLMTSEFYSAAFPINAVTGDPEY